jgi:hypothetical protein
LYIWSLCVYKIGVYFQPVQPPFYCQDIFTHSVYFNYCLRNVASVFVK